MLWIPAGAAVLAWAALLSAADLRHRRLPNRWTLGGAACILAAAAAGGRWWPAAAGALTLAAVYLAVHLVAPRGLGGGDVKLALGLGALTGGLGLQVWVLAALGAPLISAVAGLVSVARGRGRVVAHGPSMCAASLAAAAAAVL